MEFHIELTELALEMISAIKDRREQQGIISRIQKLKSEPLQQGKPLTGDLKGLYSVRAVGQRIGLYIRLSQRKFLWSWLA